MNYGQTAKVLIEKRNWADSHLPTYGTLICYDLALHVLRAVGGETPVALKQLYRTLPYSEAHLRRQLRRFEEDQWVRSRPHPDDARNRFVEPTEKMLSAYREYFLLYLAVAASISANVESRQ
jgi:DNA-binding MarR family transcriptional regulator